MAMLFDNVIFKTIMSLCKSLLDRCAQLVHKSGIIVKTPLVAKDTGITLGFLWRTFGRPCNFTECVDLLKPSRATICMLRPLEKWSSEMLPQLASSAAPL